MSNEMIIGENNTLIIAANRPIWTGVAPAISCTGISTRQRITTSLLRRYLILLLRFNHIPVLQLGKEFQADVYKQPTSQWPRGDVKFDIISDSHMDAMPLRSQVGYTITGSSLTWHYALPSVSKKRENYRET